MLPDPGSLTKFSEKTSLLSWECCPWVAARRCPSTTGTLNSDACDDAALDEEDVPPAPSLGCGRNLARVLTDPLLGIRSWVKRSSLTSALMSTPAMASCTKAPEQQGETQLAPRAVRQWVWLARVPPWAPPPAGAWTVPKAEGRARPEATEGSH